LGTDHDTCVVGELGSEREGKVGIVEEGEIPIFKREIDGNHTSWSDSDENEGGDGPADAKALAGEGGGNSRS